MLAAPYPITSQTSAKIAEDSLAHRSYPTAPVSNLYVFGRVQDLAFEEPTNDVQNRGHIRTWETAFADIARDPRPCPSRSHSCDEALAKRYCFAYTLICNSCCINLRNKHFLGESHDDKRDKKNRERATMMDNTWLVFFPQTPATPSSLRVLVWRRLQQVGAINLQSGAWMLPHTPEQEQALWTLLAEMEQQGGSGFFLEARTPTGAIQADLIERFQAERAKEYQEFGERCQEFLQEIEKETRAHKFTFAELEENEQELLKLTRWLRKIQQRDFFPGSPSREIVARLASCHQALQAFTAMVYKQEGLPTPNSEDAPQIDSVQEEGKDRETWES